MVRPGHPFARRKALTLEDYLALDHLSPTPQASAHVSPIDGRLAQLGLKRRIRVSVPEFTVVPYVLAVNDLVFTSGRSFIEHLASIFPFAVLEAPPELGAMRFYMLWHERSHRGGPRPLAPLARASRRPRDGRARARRDSGREALIHTGTAIDSITPGRRSRRSRQGPRLRGRPARGFHVANRSNGAQLNALPMVRSRCRTLDVDPRTIPRATSPLVERTGRGDSPYQGESGPVATRAIHHADA